MNNKIGEPPLDEDTEEAERERRRLVREEQAIEEYEYKKSSEDYHV